MSTKHKQKKIKGIKVVEAIQGKENRPLFPRPAVFRSKKKYDRKREKQQLLREDS